MWETCTQKAYTPQSALPPSTIALECDGMDVITNAPASCSSTNKCGFILDLHGYTMDGETQVLNDELFERGPKAGFVVVAPNSPYSAWEGLEYGPYWAPDRHTSSLLAIIDDAISDPVIDTNRIHVTGFSQGGFMTWELLCQASEKICSIGEK